MAALQPITENEIDPSAEMARLCFGTSPQDSIDFIERYLTIPNENGQVVHFKLFPQQKLMLQRATGRDITVKGRQTRASSVLIAARLRRMIFQRYGANGIIGAQDDITTALFRNQIKHHIRDLQEAGFDLGLKKDNADELVIAVRENRIEFVSGEQATFGRAFARQEVHLSELAHWKASSTESLLGGLMPSIPPAPMGMVDFESTPNGQEGAFFKYAMAAKPMHPLDEFTLQFYEWWNDPRYTVSTDPMSGCNIILSESMLSELESTFVPSEEEQRLMSMFNLAPRRILWRRLKKAAQDKTDAPFIQEFPEDVHKCWVGMSGRFFDTADGEDHLQYYRDEERRPVKYLDSLNFEGDNISFYGPNLAIWEQPLPGEAYVVAFDAASGGQGAQYDSTSIGVWNASKEKRVARCVVQASPKQVGAMVCAIGAYYGTALVSGERSHHGQVVFDTIRDLHYSNVFYYTDPDKPLGKNEVPKPGMYPSVRYRQMVLEEFKRAVVNHEAALYDPLLNQQMAMFSWQKVQDRMKAMAEKKAGAHDDVVMEAAFGWFACKFARLRRSVSQRREERQRDTIQNNGGYAIQGMDPRTNKHIWLT